MKIRDRWIERTRQTLLYVFSLFLLIEWIRPLAELTDTGYTYVFLLFIILSLFLHAFFIHWLVRFIVLAIFLVVATGIIHFDGAFTRIGDYLAELMLNITYVWERDWSLLTNSFRTMLLFVMLWLVAYLIHYWMRIKSSMFPFFVVTILFLAVLDTFTPYDAKMIIIRVVIVGFMTMGLVTLFRLVQLEKVSLSSRLFGVWMVPLVLMLACSAFFGMTAPKFDPQWPDPVPFLQSFSEHAAGSEAAYSKVGYGEDDSRLGGTVHPDSSVVFYHTAKLPHYWKVESKDVYTGKGWVSNSGGLWTFPNGEEWTEFENYEAPENVSTNSFEASVSIVEDNQHILYPAGGFLKKVDADGVEAFRYDSSISRIVPITDQHSVQEYTLHYEQPQYDISELRKVTTPDDTMDKLLAQHTQLPETVPDRVRALAVELTENQANWYDKVKAVENYFDQSEFVYSKENIPYPSENQDYVDQFLFQTKIGYCDNFSTSMVVLLRAAGIPARWVKGYTEGERTSYQGDLVYEVTNNNAHSWVEVYFPGIGWVSFEPTKGFSGSGEFLNSELQGGENRVESTLSQQKERGVSEQEKTEKNVESEQATTNGNLNVMVGWTWWGMGGILLVFGVFLLYWTRRKWLPILLIARFNRKEDCFTEAYEVLVKQLQRAGLKRSEGQTLRDYAAYIDSLYETNQMAELTRQYEMMIYRGDTEGNVWGEYRDIWKFLMNRSGY
jgi:transglutaminase-like putative cysteine protease